MRTSAPHPEHFGWQDETAFLYGDRIYTPTEIIKCDIGGSLSRRTGGMRRHGEPEKWSRAAAACFAKGRETYAVALLASFAAPIVQLYGEGAGGIIISIVSDSDAGGTSVASDAIASVWGNNESITSATDDEIDGIGSLPVLYDRLYLRDPSLIAEFVRTFTEHAPPTSLICPTDHSLVGVLRGVAGDQHYRVLEYSAASIGNRWHSTRRDLRGNCGWAADAFLKRLVQPETINYLKDALPHWEAEIWDYTGLSEHNRYQVKALACIAAAAHVVNAIGLVEFSPSRIVTWALDQSKVHVDEKSPTLNPAALITEFLKMQMPCSLVVKYGTSPPRNPAMKQTPLIRPGPELNVRYETEEGLTYIRKTALDEWLKQRGLNPNDVIGPLFKARLVLHEKSAKTLGASTEYANRQDRCYRLTLRHPLAENMFPFDLG